MNRIECSRKAPWGNHETLRDHECPRCGWTAERWASPAPGPEAKPRQGWRLFLSLLGARGALGTRSAA